MLNINYDSGMHFGGLNPIVATCVWKNIILACSLYGCNVWGQLSAMEYNTLEIVQRNFSKRIQGLPKQTSGIVALDNINLETIQAYIDKQALFLFGKLCRANTGFYFKRVFIGRLTMYKYECISQSKCTLSPLYNMLRLLYKYDMHDVLDTYIATSTVPPKQIFKRLVNSSISAYESSVRLYEMSIRLDLCRYVNIRSENVNRLWTLCQIYHGHFYDFAKIVKLASCKLISGECQCGIYAYDIVKHVLMHCRMNMYERNEFFERLCDIIDVESFVKLWGNEDESILQIILGGMPSFFDEMSIDDY
jgi:hypothetical protein